MQCVNGHLKYLLVTHMYNNKAINVFTCGSFHTKSTKKKSSPTSFNLIIKLYILPER